MSIAQRLGLPWFAPPEQPYVVEHVRVDETTTPRQLALRTIWAPRRFVIPAAFLAILHQLGEAMVPVLAGLAIDNAVRGVDGGQLALWIGLLGVDFLVLSFAYRFGSRISFSGMHAVRQQLRMRVAGRFLDPRGTSKGDSLPGESMSIANSDVDRLTLVVALGVYPVGELIAIVFCAIVLLTISWPLGLGVLIGVPALLFVLDRAGEPLRKRSGHEQELAARAAGRAADLMGGYRIIKGARGEQHAELRYREASQDALGATLHARRAFGSFLGLGSVITGVFIALVGTAAGLLTVRGELSIAELVTIAGLSQFLIGPVEAISTNFGMFWSRALASAARVLTVLQESPRHVGERRGDDDGVAVELAAVPVGELPPVDLRIDPGEFVVVRAESAAGSDLFKLLSGSSPRSGRVTYGGVDAGELEPDWLRSRVITAPHEARLFPGSILDNVGLQRAEYDDTMAALEAAGCTDLLDGSPDGADTDVGAEGERLSGGQRQRVALARALAAQPPVLVLHDPTTAVDSVTEVEIVERVRVHREGLTTIVISDSPAFRAVADRVIDLGGAGR